MIMNIPPKFVVLDDKIEHLEPIIEAFKEMGTSCNGIKYDEQDEKHLNPLYYKGVRFLFSDLHLNNPSGGDKQHYAEIIRILKNIINKENGPYILILWTSYPDKCKELNEYINDIDDKEEEKNNWRPIYITSLPKEKYGINTQSNKIAPEKINSLKNDIREILNNIPQINLLFQWESDIITSASKTINEIISLKITEGKNSEIQNDIDCKSPENSDLFYKENIIKLDTIFSHITKETVGKSHVSSNPKKSFNLSILPILFDNILNSKSDENQELWNKAITKYNEKTKMNNNKDIGGFNRMLHLSLSKNESIQATDWGAVIELGQEYSQKLCNDLFQVNTDDLFDQEFNISKKITSKNPLDIEPILVRIGAACDYAQNKERLIPYIIGYKISIEELDNSKSTDKVKKEITKLGKEPSLWLSPLFYQKDSSNKEGFYILLKLPLKIMLKKDFFKNKNITINYRIREQLLTNLIHNIASYSSRIGFNQLR